MASLFYHAWPANGDPGPPGRRDALSRPAGPLHGVGGMTGCGEVDGCREAERTFEGVNEAFHGAYGQVRARAERESAVFVFLDDVLWVVRGVSRLSLPVTPPVFRLLKAAAHGPVGLYAALCGLADGPLPSDARETLRAYLACLERAASTGPRGAVRSDEVALVKDVTKATRDFLRALLAADLLQRSALERFARALGPRLLILTEAATRAQLEALHRQVETAYGELSPAERRGLEVVVAGDHQARERSSAMQYFRKRFQEPKGAEVNVAYAENVTTLEEALALVGVRRVDRAIARAFFGDERRLQRDVLGDAAKSILAHETFTPLG